MYSTTYLAEIVKVVAMLGIVFGFEVDEQILLEVVSATAFVVAQVYTLYKRFQLGGVNAFGIRK